MFRFLNSAEINIPIQKRMRANNNATHDSFVDQQIKNASLWKIHKHKKICAIILYILSFGILFLITRISNKFYILLLCVPSLIQEADYIMITDIQNNKNLLPIITETFSLSELKKIKSTIYYHRYITKPQIENNNNTTIAISNNHLSSTNENTIENEKCFYFLSNKYKYDHINHIFIPVAFYLNNYTYKELSLFKNGIPSLNILTYLKQIHLPNKTHLKQYTLLKLILLECFNWSYIYNFISIIIWLIDLWYWQFAIVTSILSLFLIITAALRKKQTLYHICNYNSIISDIKVKRPYYNHLHSIPDEDGFINIKHTNILPGDIIKIEKHINDKQTLLTIPCDGIILEGYCTINESDLTGENTLVLKKELSLNNSDETYFNFNKHKQNIIYQGSSISTLYLPRNKKEQLILLVIDTGYNTYRGNMVTNWERHIPHNNTNRFNKDLIVLGSVFTFIWILTSIFVFFFYNTTYNINTNKIEILSYTKRFLLCLDNITVVLPPSMSICINFCRLFFNKKLQQTGISCILERKVEDAGRVDVIVLDKTGTLTESKCEIYCYKVNQLDHNGLLKLGNEEFDPNVLNKIYRCVLNRIFNLKMNSLLFKRQFNQSYQTSLLYNIIYFTECIACCHNVFPINNRVFGNSLDMEIFKESKWELSQETENINSDVFVHPRYSLKITELNKENNNKLYKLKRKNKQDIKINTNFHLKYIERFEFISQLQCISVLIENSIDGSIRAYAKGAPEKIKNICIQNSLPSDLDIQLEHYTSKGFRVLACATKLIHKYNKQTLSREDLENEMQFLGLIIFKNQIKPNTKANINLLKTAKCDLVIATGDNVYTTINVAKQCDIITKNTSIIHLETCKTNNEFLLIKYYPSELTIELNHQLNSSKFKSNLPFINNDNDSYIYNDNINSIHNNNSSSTCNYNDGKITISEKDELCKFMSIISLIISKDNIALCISGTTLSLILTRLKNRIQYKQIPFTMLVNLVIEKGKIFYRMLPEHKSNLISLLQSYKNNIVAMCGDGANDCRAFMTADIGIAINQTTNTTLISHFYTKKDSIACIITILLNGRACFENKVIIIKFMILYSLIQITSVLFLNLESQSMNDHQYLFTDLFFILVPMIIAVSTMASKKTANKKPSKIIINKYFIYSVLGQMVLQIGSQFLYGLLIRKRTIHSNLDVRPRNDLNVLSTYIYVFALFQYLNVLFIFNSTSLYRKKFYTNKVYMIYYGLCFLLSVCFISIKDMPRKLFGMKLILFEDDTINFEYRLEINKVITIIWILIGFVVCILYEGILYKKCMRK